MSRKLIIALSFAFASILMAQRAVAEEKQDHRHHHSCHEHNSDHHHCQKSPN